MRLIHDPEISQTATLQPCFAIKTVNVSDQPLQLHQCKTKHFYVHLLHATKIAIPSLNHRQQSLSQPPNFDHSFWKATYPILANKQGDVNWKISHRILPSTHFIVPQCIIFQIATDATLQKTLNIFSFIALLRHLYGLLYRHISTN